LTAVPDDGDGFLFYNLDIRVAVIINTRQFLSPSCNFLGLDIWFQVKYIRSDLIYRFYATTNGDAS